MTTTRSANEIWLIGIPKSDLNASCLPTNSELLKAMNHPANSGGLQ